MSDNNDKNNSSKSPSYKTFLQRNFFSLSQMFGSLGTESGDGEETEVVDKERACNSADANVLPEIFDNNLMSDPVDEEEVDGSIGEPAIESTTNVYSDLEVVE